LEIKIIIEVAIMLLLGLLFGRLAKFLKLPNVTGYLFAGLLLGPSFLNFIPAEMVGGFSIISDIALGLIAFSIGSEFKLSYYKKVGMSPVIIAIAESFGAIILVVSALILFGFDVKLSIMLGAIAAATAPAQTLMVINQYRSKGPLTSMLMSVVAIDDVVALVGFGFAVTIVKIMSSTVKTNIIVSLLQPFLEIGISIILGVLMSILMKLMFRWFKKSSNRICIILSSILITYWLAETLNGSALLACMILGAMLANILVDMDHISKITESFSPPIFMIFFVISGAGFEISALKGIGIIGLLYVVMRVAGKIAGAWVGGKITKQESKICKYLGPTLMPQAGVALGLIVVAGSVIPEYAPQIRVIILCSTFLYSIVGPAVAKYALVKSGEIVLEDKKNKDSVNKKIP